MKTTILILFYLLGIWSNVFAQSPLVLPIAKHLKGWRAHSATETSRGFIIVGEQSYKVGRSRLVVVHTDSTGQTRWVRTYSHLKGQIAAYTVTTNDSNGLFIAGCHNGIAKVWQIDPLHRGNIIRTLSLDTGKVTSIKTTSQGQLVMAIEQGNRIKVISVGPDGRIHWERKWVCRDRCNSLVFITKEGLTMVIFMGQSYALDSNGQLVWEYHNEAVQWHGLYQRINGEVLLIGQQKTQMFGPVNDEAFVVAVRPLLQKFEWFQNYGRDDTFDAAYQVAERPNGQLVILTKQGRRPRLLELNQNLSVAKSTWLHDSLDKNFPQLVAMLAQSSWQDKWFLVSNHPDGSVRLHPSKGQERSIASSDLSFELLAKNYRGVPTLLTPVAEVPITYELPTDSGTCTLHFRHIQGNGYAYLLQRSRDSDIWQDKGWIQLGSCDSLFLPLSPQFEYIVMIASRPFAVPIQRLLKSDAYGADQLAPENPKETLHRQYPTTFNASLKVNVSASGQKFMIENIPNDGWIPLRFKTSEKKISQKR